ncbi:MAG: ABC transporter ATP-binding protein [Gemmatimonadaceae bacterium]
MSGNSDGFVNTHSDTLVVQNLSVPFGTKPGLRDLSLRVAKGERVVIVGPSGAGKTSLLRAIAGLTDVTRGSISISGRDVAQLPPEQRGAVYMHQTPLLFPHLNIFENVAFPLRVRGVGSVELRDRVNDSLEKVQMSAFSTRAPQTLSGGQQHRVALARAVISRPELLLLDEPFSSLDPSLRDDVREALVALQTAFQLSVLMVTHDIDEASKLADRIAVMKDGDILQTGVPAEVFEAPATIAIAAALGRRAVLAGVLVQGRRLECAIGDIPLDATPTFAGVRMTTENTNVDVSILFLPGALSLALPANDGPVFEIARITYGGDGPTALLKVDGDTLDVAIPVQMMSANHSAPAIAVGSRVTVRVAPSRVRVFRK